MIKVCVLSGGTSTERTVSLLSSKEIVDHLDLNKYVVSNVEIPEERSGQWIQKLLDDPPDIVVSGLHGGLGEDGSIQGLLECLQIPYVGSKVMSSAVCMDKMMSKWIMKSHHIPVAEHVFMLRSESMDFYEERIKTLGFPLVVKPNRGGSSVGISIVQSFEELEKAVGLVKSFHDDILIEQFIEGKEVTCGVYETSEGLHVLTVLDIDAKTKFYDYEAKYWDDNTEIQFSTLPDYLQTMIQEIAKKCFRVLHCAGYGRVDLRVHEEQVYVIEMNTLPGLTSHSLIPKAASKTMTFGQFLDRLIEFELGKK